MYHISLHPIAAAEVAITSKQFQFPFPCLHPLVIKKPNLPLHAEDLPLKIFLGFSPVQVRLGKHWDFGEGRKTAVWWCSASSWLFKINWTSLPYPGKPWRTGFSLFSIYGLPYMCCWLSKHLTSFTKNDVNLKHKGVGGQKHHQRVVFTGNSKRTEVLKKNMGSKEKDKHPIFLWADRSYIIFRNCSQI